MINNIDNSLISRYDIEGIYNALNIPILIDMTNEIFDKLEPNLSKYGDGIPLYDEQSITIRSSKTAFKIEDIIKIYFYTPTGRISKQAYNYRESNILYFDKEKNNYIEESEDYITYISSDLLENKSNELINRIIRVYNYCMDDLDKKTSVSFGFMTINLKDNLNFKYTAKYANGDIMSEQEMIIDINSILTNNDL